MWLNPENGLWEDEPRKRFQSDYLNNLGNFLISTSVSSGNFMGFDPALPGAHFGMVRSMRKEFKQYSKEEFRSLPKDPIVKNILSGSTKLTKEQIAERIKEHLED